MAHTEKRGVGKCSDAHLGSYGYPTRPEEPYPFCAQCGQPMVWQCPECGERVPEDNDELTTARFCRQCGAGYFADERPASGSPELPQPPPGVGDPH